MKPLYLLLSILIIPVLLSAQDQKHVVFLKDKNNNPYSLSDPGAFLSQRALDRRTHAGIALDQKDLPVTPSYVAQIAATGAPVVYTLKWFNAVVINTGDPTILAAVTALPFVDHIDVVMADHPVRVSNPEGVQDIPGIQPVTTGTPLPKATFRQTGSINYGQAYNQAHMIAVDGLHDLGFTGDGMVIAVLDAGFYHVDQLPAFDSLWLTGRILGTRDFNLPGNNVFGDNMHTHGTSVLSTMGANLPGDMVGTSPHASFWLVRTEVGDYEALIEEYNWAAGAEFADSVGADVINSSLGYTTFDNPAFNHTYAQMDGNTTPATRAGDLACSRGLLVVNSAGNEGGSSWQYIGAPADGDSVFTIGAVTAQGIYASFSSTGPTSDGRVKPDVTAQGSGTTIASPWGFTTQGSGTSFSSPVTAGALACLWQSVPSFSAEQIRNAVRSTASQASNPDPQYGYGIPNMMSAKALMSLPEKHNGAGPHCTLSPVPFTTAPVLRIESDIAGDARYEILNITGETVYSGNHQVNGTTDFRVGAFSSCTPGIYFLRVTTSAGQTVLRAVKI